MELWMILAALALGFLAAAAWIVWNLVAIVRSMEDD